MREGLYRVRFRTREDDGSGVAVLRDGRFLGGDSSASYAGRYRVDGDRFEVELTVAVHTFVGWMMPVLLAERATITLVGQVEGDRIAFAGEADTPSRTRLEVEMELIEPWEARALPAGSRPPSIL